MNVVALIKKAQRKLQQGDARAAIELLTGLRNAGVARAESCDLEALARQALGDTVNALALVEQAMQLGGATIERVMRYGDLLRGAGKWQQAADVYQQVIAQLPEHNPAWYGLGMCLLGAGEPSRAGACFSGVLSRDPDNHDACLRLALCKLAIGEAAAAVVLYEQVRARTGPVAEIDVEYADALLRSMRPDEAASLLEPLQDHPAVGLAAKRRLVSAWLLTDKSESASALLSQLMSDAELAQDPELLAMRVRLDLTEGKTERALETLQQLIARQPTESTLWNQYLDATGKPLSADLLSALHQAQHAVAERQLTHQQAGLYFAEALHWRAAKDFPQEMALLDKANQCKAVLMPYDAALHADNARRLREHYDASRIHSLSVHGDIDTRPIFILAPPRSGTTLLEQALARHDQVFAGGESNLAGEAWHQVTGEWTLSARPELHDTLNAEQVGAFAKAYRQAMSRLGVPDGARMVHKGINNHKFAGLLRAAFPHARFIDLRRHPVDVAFGCYRQNFDSQSFSFSVDGCAAELAIFQSNMDWWQQQMPDSIYRLNYEDLVEAPEAALRSLLAWCDLPWQPQCLDFSKVGRVATASVNQVRQGLNKAGMHQWQRYGSAMAPLLDALRRYNVWVQPDQDRDAGSSQSGASGGQ